MAEFVPVFEFLAAVGVACAGVVWIVGMVRSL